MVLLRFAIRVATLYVSWKNLARNKNKKSRISPPVTIGALPDNVLLDIFDLYCQKVAPLRWEHRMIDLGLVPFPAPAHVPWNTLVHVCQRWRYVVFASPVRLDLCLRCTSETPVRETLDVWPPLPIEIALRDSVSYDVDNVIATLEHPDRVRNILIGNLTCSQLERLVPMMQEPFPVLTILQLWAGETTPALPDMFLGGSAPRLQALSLMGIPFPRLPRILLSATNLSRLTLERTPHTGYISPEAMVTGLSALTRLRYLIIQFISPASRPDRRGRRPPLTRVILPALEELEFRGVSEYLEDLVARVVAPRLRTFHISFLNQLIFDIQQLPYFIGHARILSSSSKATVIIVEDYVVIRLNPPTETNTLSDFRLGIYCKVVDWQVSSMAQICNQFSFFPSIVEQLTIQHRDIDWESTQQVDMDDTQWLELFRPFTAVRTLRISCRMQPLIVPALQELTGERATEVLPALDSLYLENYQPSGSEQQAIEPFIAARQYSDHPVAVHPWEGPLGPLIRFYETMGSD